MERLTTALYGRTSKDDPNKKPIGIQQERLRRWSVSDDGVASVAGEYWDDGVSGKIPFEDRPEGKRLTQDIRAGKVQAVAVAYADRFGRTLLDGLQTVKLLEGLGASLVTVEEGWDGRRKDSPLNFQLRMMLAEEEHRRISLRMQSGKTLAMARDNAPPGGPLTFGYRLSHDGKFVIDPIEGPIVIEIFRRALSGETNRDILAWIRTQNIPAGRKFQRRAAGAAPKVCVHQLEAEWHPSKIHKILNNPTYTGVRKWGARTFPCDALVDADTFARVQLRNEQNARRYGRKAGTHDALCSGLFTCGLCGTRFYHYRAGTRKGVESMYACGARKPHCRAARMDRAAVDAAVWGQIYTYLQNPEEVVRKSLAADEGMRGAVADYDRAEAEHHAELARIDGEAEQTWTEQRENQWPTSWVVGKLNALKVQRETCLARIAAVRSGRAAAMVDRDLAAEVITFLAAIRSNLREDMAPEDKQRIIELLVAGGTVTTIGSGWKKRAELVVQLRWGELTASDKFPKDCYYGNLPHATLPVAVGLGQAS